MTNYSERHTSAPHACQPADRSRCSECALSYECMRESNGGAWNWPLVAIALIAVLAVLAV